LGLRAMFFLLAGVLDKFYLLQKGLSLVLIFIGVKMVLEISDNLFGKNYEFHIEAKWSLSIIVGLLGASVLMSLLKPQKKSKTQHNSSPNGADSRIESVSPTVIPSPEVEDSRTT
ncbi:MAG: hypothetical protein RMM53_00400, partial [Bacteroidia bacterium]|nr:hypothetical protein [Bacteroidia bacterium]